jgi:hypothetical protein
MDWQAFQHHFSIARTKRFLDHATGDTAEAHAAYLTNIRLAQSLMPLLHVLEVVLRNAIHNSLTRSLGRPDWWSSLDERDFAGILLEVHTTQAKLRKRRESDFPDKVVAEMTFGFWTSLFNVRYQASLWRMLRLAFPHCPKKLRQRHLISTSLNGIRNLRNRVFHHEPLLWLKPTPVAVTEQAMQLLGWLDPRLVKWMTERGDTYACWTPCTVLLQSVATDTEALSELTATKVA